MFNNRVIYDFHMHTNNSTDGTIGTVELIKNIREKSILYYSITDHNTIGAYNSERKQSNNDIIPGIEISAMDEKGSILHILGYAFRTDNSLLLQYSQEYRNLEYINAMKVVRFLSKEGIKLDISALKGRINYKYMEKFIQKCGHESNIYENYLGKKISHLMKISMLNVKEAIDLIHEAGGFAVLAHPVRYASNLQERFNILSTVAEMGIDGIECYHPSADQTTVQTFVEFCEKRKLLISGGTDYHGKAPYCDLGQYILGMETQCNMQLEKTYQIFKKRCRELYEVEI